VVRPGRPLTDLELRHIRLLLQLREWAHGHARSDDERLEDFVLECCDDGSSVRVIAEALGVGASTVQGWVSNARRRRRNG
jgi:transposase-like protein